MNAVIKPKKKKTKPLRCARTFFEPGPPRPPKKTKPLQWRDLEKDWYKRVCPYLLPHAYEEEEEENITLPGCDFKHWLVVVKGVYEEHYHYLIINNYIKTLAKVVGSYEEARMRIYSVATGCYYAFGVLASEELTHKLRELPEVDWVFPDSYVDARMRTYGGEPFINGLPVRYDMRNYQDWLVNFSELRFKEYKREIRRKKL